MFKFPTSATSRRSKVFFELEEMPKRLNRTSEGAVRLHHLKESFVNQASNNEANYLRANQLPAFRKAGNGEKCSLKKLYLAPHCQEKENVRKENTACLKVTLAK